MGRARRQRLETKDGWTVITRDVSRLCLSGDDDDDDDNERRYPRSKHGNGNGNGNGNDKRRPNISLLRPERLVDNLTAEKVLAEFQGMQEQWHQTGLAHQLDDLVRKHDWRVREAACVGIGSFSRDWPHRWRSLWQLVLFIAVVDRLGSLQQEEKEEEEEEEEEEKEEDEEDEEKKEKKDKKEHRIKMWAQDPALTAVDVDFLRFLQIEVVPDGMETHLSPCSFVYSPFVDWFLLLPTFLGCQPAADRRSGPVLYIGNEILSDYTLYAETEEKRQSVGECNRLGRAFLEQRESVRLQDFGLHAHALAGLILYWRLT